MVSIFTFDLSLNLDFFKDNCKKNLDFFKANNKKNLDFFNNTIIFTIKITSIMQGFIMLRSITDKLLKWKMRHRRKPLIVRGARQIGKTWSIEEFGRANYSSMYKIDFEKLRSIHAVFAENLDPRRIVEQLEIILNAKIDINNTLIFFDEIQACPRALMSLRYFYEELPELHIIAAGSLLDFILKDSSFPVGRVQFLNMYPCTFYEFLCATGKNLAAEKLLAPPIKLPAATHELLLNELKKYFFIGGMPEVIKTYIENGSMLEAFEVQAEIIDSYRQDFSKYAPRADKRCLDMVLNNLSAMVGEQLKYSKLAEGFSNQTIHKAFDLLEQARVIIKICSTIPGFPLGAGVNNKKFKAAMLDLGLMQSLAHLPVNREIQQTDLLAIFRGKLAEQFVAQELTASKNREVYYWSRTARGSAAEVDFILAVDEHIIPIEVKSGKGGSLRSLHLMLETYPNCPEGLVLYSGNFAECPEQKLKFIPLYYAGML